MVWWTVLVEHGDWVEIRGVRGWLLVEGEGDGEREREFWLCSGPMLRSFETGRAVAMGGRGGEEGV